MTIGEILKNARVDKKYSIAHLEGLTKIKRSFIEAIEEENWSVLPPFPTVLGFVKSVAGALEVDEKTAVAVLKRDYTPKKLVISPKPDIGSKFVWSPKITFMIGVGLVLLVVFGYLGFQYYRFTSPPKLSVDSPKEAQAVSGNSVLVFGTTDIDSKLTVNNQPVLVDDNGKFSVSINIVPETKEVVIKAISRSGKETVVSRTIKIQSN